VKVLIANLDKNLFVYFVQDLPRHIKMTANYQIILVVQNYLVPRNKLQESNKLDVYPFSSGELLYEK
jgi:hypothetical protein